MRTCKIVTVLMTKFGEFLRRFLCNTSFYAFVITYLLVNPTLAHGNLPQALENLKAGDIESAVSNLEHALSDGDGRAAFYLGRILELGIGTDPNQATALHFYMMGSELGSAEATNRLGLAFLSGWQVPQDRQAAKRLLCKAAELGDTNGQYNCASLLLSDPPDQRDEPGAYAMYQRAFDAGHKDAGIFLAKAMIEGRYLPKNPERAFTLVEVSLRRGSIEALKLYAHMTEQGIGSLIDVNKSAAASALVRDLGKLPRTAADEVLSDAARQELERLRGLFASEAPN